MTKTLALLPGGSLHEHAEWLIGPVGQHRDSDSIEESNFRVAVAAFVALDPNERDHEVHRFGHWAVGWIEEIATRPGSACAKLANEMREQLKSYSILDDDDHSALEAEQVDANLPAIMSDLRRDLVKEFAKRQDPDDPTDATIDEITDALDEMSDDALLGVAADHVTEQRDGWEYFCVTTVADALVDRGMI